MGSGVYLISLLLLTTLLPRANSSGVKVYCVGSSSCFRVSLNQACHVHVQLTWAYIAEKAKEVLLKRANEKIRDKHFSEPWISYLAIESVMITLREGRIRTSESVGQIED